MQLLRKMVLATKTGLFQLLLILMFLYMFSNLKVSSGSDTILSGQSLYGNQGLVSKGGKFELGFFSPANSTNYYVGIWYKYIPGQQVVWVANREAPIRQFSNNSRLVLAEDGRFILFSDLKEEVWALNTSVGISSVPNKGVLLDNGDFILSDGLNIIWQSFDYPTDTWLPGAKLGIDESLINKRQVLTSWSSPDDPASGNFSFGMDPRGDTNEFFAWLNQSEVVWRSGIWNGRDFASFPIAMTNFSYVSNPRASYFTYNFKNETYSSTRYVINNQGEINQLIWIDNLQRWYVFLTQPADSCKEFAFCGPNAVCDINSSPPCGCYEEFEPRSPEEWSTANFAGGCRRTNPPKCSDNTFTSVRGISLPANSSSLNLENDQVCLMACLAKCSCTAYAYSNSGGCSLWTGDLLDAQTLVKPQVNLYIRSSYTGQLASDLRNKKKSHVPVALYITIPLLVIILLTCILWCVYRKASNRKEAGETSEDLFFLNLETTSNRSGEEKKVLNLPQFSFSSISAITNNFSPANKLGEGGFGPVYKGNLFDGQSVAVKRLSNKSGQGLEELKNETVLIAKLQHRNLVRLLGCCIEQDEKILIYEYMPNKSLDYFIFDPSKQNLLDWRRLVQIIEGIAQGLLYLHQHSRLRIVHRDLKASNILLDDEMNPKISDFGMARIFGGDVLEANTNRIVGTYGYMSPEYAMEGLFSIKSDVFAFGVLLLEILSGKKNTGFRHLDCLSLLGYAWELWNNERVLDLIDSNLDVPSSSFMPLRYIHVGLLCVQESPADRPTMSDVLAMFSNEHMHLVLPKRPAFTSGGSLVSAPDKPDHCSVNQLTTSVIDGR